MGFFRALAEAYGNMFEFEGRATRRQYLAFLLFALSFIVTWGILTAARMSELESEIDVAVTFVAISLLLLNVIVTVFFLLPFMSLSSRRLQDANWSGWWIILGLAIPILGILLLTLACAVLPGAKSDNAYGPNPRDRDAVRRHTAEVARFPIPPMGFWTAVGTCFRRTFDFQGRARRKEYWYFVLFQAILIYALSVAVLTTSVMAALAVNGDPIPSELRGVFQSPGVEKLSPETAAAAWAWVLDNFGLAIGFWAAYAGMLLVFFLPNLAVTIRRLHDTDRSGWFILMPLGVYLICSLGAYAMMFLAVLVGAVALVAAIVVALIPHGALVWYCVVLCQPSSFDDNRFGPDPIPNRKRPAPSHPAFAQELQGAARAEFEAARKAEIRALYRSRVLNKPT